MPFLKYAKLLFFVVFSSLVAITLSYIVAEKYFFDKFFYEKSVAHGYFPAEKSVPLESFKRRAKDLIAYNKLVSNENSASVLGTHTDRDVFTIAVIGDSYTWGQGVTNDELFGVLLEKKLDKIRETDILLLGRSGNSILDYISYYETLKLNNQDIDLYIFGIVTNDILPFFEGEYSPTAQIVMADCEKQFGPVIRDINWRDETTSLEEKLKKSDSLWQDIWQSQANKCLLNGFQVLPTEKSIYYLTDYYAPNEAWDAISEKLAEYDKNILSSQKGLSLEKYSHYFEEPNKYFEVSLRDQHPSSLAHQLYADIMYSEILENEEYGFK